jgi:hypothetical protein
MWNVLCLCNGFDSAGNLSCTGIIIENWSAPAVEDPFVNLVGKVGNILQEFKFCDFPKQRKNLASVVLLETWVCFPDFLKITVLQMKLEAPDLLVKVNTLSRSPVSSSWIYQELRMNWDGKENVLSFPRSKLHQNSNELVAQMTIKFLITRFQKLSWSLMGLTSGLDLVSFLKRESTSNFFNIIVVLF